MTSSSWRGPAAMTAAMALFSVNDALVKAYGADLPVAQSIAIRGAVAVVATVAVILALKRREAFAGAFGRVVLLRSFAECFAIFCLITALTRLPMGDVTALSQAAPLILLPLAALVFGERIGPARWALAALGFGGVLLIARPGGAGFDPVFGLALLSAAGFAARDLMARQAGGHVSAFAATLSTVLVVAVVAGLAVALGGAAPATSAQILGLGGAGLLLSAGQALVFLAFRLAPVSDVGPFNYAKTLFGVLAGVVAFGERPDALTLAGMALVLASGVGVAIVASRSRPRA